MDKNVKDFIKRVKDTAVDAGRTVEKTGKGLLDQAKLGMQLAKLNSAVESLYTDLGKSLYNTHKGVEDADQGIDEMLMSLDGLFEEIEETKAKIASYSKSSNVCPNCGSTVKKNSAFCSTCGYKLEEVVSVKVSETEEEKECDVVTECSSNESGDCCCEEAKED